jgi:hypothetical protein
MFVIVRFVGKMHMKMEERRTQRKTSLPSRRSSIAPTTETIQGHNSNLLLTTTTPTKQQLFISHNDNRSFTLIQSTFLRFSLPPTALQLSLPQQLLNS